MLSIKDNDKYENIYDCFNCGFQKIELRNYKIELDEDLKGKQIVIKKLNKNKNEQEKENEQTKEVKKE